ncbi:linear amide C-N hydrolase [Pseudodesulfovibrio sp. zrk46]|nr:linear amide C-N hydrolase [Pseudodesulfovibrio sp. zrk46]
MNVTRLSIFLFSIITLACCNVCWACTGIQLEGFDGTVVFGRTQEWGKFDLEPKIAVYSKGQLVKSSTPDGKDGISWNVTYGFVGILLKDHVINTGMNEKGLAGGMFYHKGFAEYVDYDPKLRDSSLAPTDLLTYILSNCADIEDVKKKVSDVRVVPVVDETLKAPYPLHAMIVDPKGNSVVIEFRGGKTNIIDNPVGVITNNPTFDWHLTNLRNYCKISNVPCSDSECGNLEITPLSGGTGFLGLPGDFTSTSRFVRAALFVQTARQTCGGEDTVTESFRILDSFNVPATQSEGASNAHLLSGTQYTIVNDTKNQILYYHTMRNRCVRKIDLQKIDFGRDVERQPIPLDKPNDNGFQDVTGLLQ